MEKNEYNRHFALEQDFWWFTGRRKIILSTLRSYGILDRPIKHLDIGCGTGYDLKVFGNQFKSVGCDLHDEALQFCRRRDLRDLVRSDATQLPFRPGSFDLVTMLDVLYHKNIDDDVSVLTSVHEILKPGGHILLTDSAFNFLLSRHDLAFHARERYTKKSLGQRMKTAGFRLEKISYFNFFLFPGIALIRLLEKRDSKGNPESNLKAVPAWLNAWLHRLLTLEAFILKRTNFPVGSSIICLARKDIP